MVHFHVLARIVVVSAHIHLPRCSPLVHVATCSFLNSTQGYRTAVHCAAQLWMTEILNYISKGLPYSRNATF